MISELVHLADAWPAGMLTGQETQQRRPIHWFVDLDKEGHVLGLSPTAGQEENSPKRFLLPVNYRLGSPNQHNWLPDFMSGPPNEIFPGGVLEDYSRTTASRQEKRKGESEKQRKWRELVCEAAKALPDNETVRALKCFVIRGPRFSELRLPTMEAEQSKRLLKDFDEGKQTLSFRVSGRIAVNDPELKAWWADKAGEQRNIIVKNLRSGQDAFLPGIGPLTDSFPTVFGNVPLASFDKAPFRSYGLGSQTATFRLETAEKAAVALNMLRGDAHSHVGLGDETAVFWAVERTTGHSIPADFMHLLEKPDPLAVQDYLRGIWGTKTPTITCADFHVAILLKGTGRFSVRSWHTETLASADEHVRRFFQAIMLPDEGEQPLALKDLAWATIAKARKQKTKPTPTTYNALFESAWRGTALPFALLTAIIRRQRVELASGDPGTKDFRTRLRARTAFVQLYFALKPDNPFLATMEAIMNSKETAILCGRLLAIFDKIHNDAHNGKSSSSPANRLYGAASSTPALVFPRLCQLARYHLQKMNAGSAYKLEFGVPKERRDDGGSEDFEGLAAVVARLKEAAGGDFPRMLSLEDQGRFALGFYYERARRWPNFKPKDQAETLESERQTI